jgi:two-component system nitrogen regulation response regulator GlnG
MSPSREIKLEDLPDDLKVENVENLNDWTKVLQSWSENYLAKGNNNLLEEAIPEFERTIIKVALKKTMGRKKEAAELLGWGRNTLTRKIKELGIDN